MYHVYIIFLYLYLKRGINIKPIKNPLWNIAESGIINTELTKTSSVSNVSYYFGWNKYVVEITYITSRYEIILNYLNNELNRRTDHYLLLIIKTKSDIPILGKVQ